MKTYYFAEYPLADLIYGDEPICIDLADVSRIANEMSLTTNDLLSLMHEASDDEIAEWGVYDSDISLSDDDIDEFLNTPRTPVLKFRRILAGLSQDELADKACVSLDDVIEMEKLSGLAGEDYLKVRSLAWAVGCSVEDLL